MREIEDNKQTMLKQQQKIKNQNIKIDEIKKTHEDCENLLVKTSNDLTISKRCIAVIEKEIESANEREQHDKETIKLCKKTELSLDEEISNLKEEKAELTEWKTKKQVTVTKLLQSFKEELNKTTSEKVINRKNIQMLIKIMYVNIFSLEYFSPLEILS